MNVDKILLVDGSNFLHRNLHQPGLSELEHNGNKTGAIFGFLRSLLTSMRRYSDHYPVVVFDMGRSPRRLEIYPNYKGSLDRKEEREKLKEEVSHGIRPESDLVDPFFEQLVHQGDAIKAILNTMKIPVVNLRGWEGDDLMAIISRNAKKCVLATDDQDMWQLITPDVSVFRPMSIDKETETRGVEVTYGDMVEWYGEVEPIRQFLVSKVIVGDGSDNIPKVANGVGGVTAQKVAKHLVNYELAIDGLNRGYEPDMYEIDQHWQVALEGIRGDISAKRFESLMQGWDQYNLNMMLMDLSLIPNDPLVMREYHGQVEYCSSIANFIEVVTILTKYGISGFDYTQALSITSALKMRLGESQDGGNI